MLYRKAKNGDLLSALGYGCMRFSRAGGKIDFQKAKEEIDEAISLGVNYFDTAYIYPGSEDTLGRILEANGRRSDIFIADKLPQYLVRRWGDIDRYFAEQLSRLRTGWIDYYLMHMLTDVASWNKLLSLGILEWADRMKASGQIRALGFSYHGDSEMFIKILEAYDWDFCQIQYNYLDEHTQAGRRGLEAAAARGIPVIIMEPLRGGRLVGMLPSSAKDMIARDPVARSAAALALRWLWDQEGVTCVLSGMNSLEMIRENAHLASECTPGSLSCEERELIARVREEIQARVKVGCTGCSYCMPCPKGIDIPGTFRCYNTIYTESLRHGRNEYRQAVALRRDGAFASECIGCGKCESHCPQKLDIRELLKDADRALCPPVNKLILKAARAFLFGKRTPRDN